MRRLALLIASAVLACACASVARPQSLAVIVEPTDESRAELRRVVTQALGRADVTLADDALTRDSYLLIEQSPARDTGGQRLTGRDFGRPETFRLVKEGAQCMLVHESAERRDDESAERRYDEGAERRYELKRTQCAGRE